MSFTIKCNNCGNEVTINNENVNTYMKVYGWAKGKTGIHKVDVIDKLIVGAIEDDGYVTIICNCENRIEA